MDILTFKIKQTANVLAQKLLEQAKRYEPPITEDLQSIALLTKAKMVDVKDKFKSAESLARKLLLFAEKDKSAEPITQKLKKFARTNSDTLRYTFVFANDEYAEGFHDATARLRQNGYKILTGRIWNAWQTADTTKDVDYRGINITLISSQNQKFELQFHTIESFRLKTETHNFYEQLRDVKISDKRKDEIIKRMRKLAEKVEQPKGI